MKAKYIGLLCSIVVLGACNKSANSNAPDDKGRSPVGQAGGKLPAYSATSLSGTLMGAAWQARAAALKKTADGYSVVIYGEAVDACAPASAAKAPIANVGLKDLSAGKDLVFDPAAARTEVTVAFTKLNTVVVAELAKAQVVSLSASGLKLSLYAKASGEDGLSEVNGQIDAVDCAKQFDFSNWTSLIGQYKLVRFDGRDVGSDWQTAYIDADGRVADSSGRTLEMTRFPLFASVGTGTSMSYNFGPIKGLGASSLSQAGGTRVLTYDVNEPVVFRGTNCTLIMHLEVKADNSSHNLEVVYTLEVPGHVAKASHAFSLEKL